MASAFSDPRSRALPEAVGVRTRPLTRDEVLTAAEVADLLKLPKSTVYELARRGVLPAARLGRTLRFVRSDVERRVREPLD
jgi:excisionase family DNA binding protein